MAPIASTEAQIPSIEPFTERHRLVFRVADRDIVVTRENLGRLHAALLSALQAMDSSDREALVQATRHATYWYNPQFAQLGRWHLRGRGDHFELVIRWVTTEWVLIEYRAEPRWSAGEWFIPQVSRRVIHRRR